MNFDMKTELLRELMAFLLEGETKETKAGDDHWKIGQAYYIRTVTHHQTGRLVAVTDKELVMEDCAWIADSGRWADAHKTGDLGEVEPFPEGERVIIGRGALIDAVPWNHSLPCSQK